MKGVGYALFASHLRQSVLVGLNSRDMVCDSSSSFLGELKGLVWALNDSKPLIQGKPVVLWTDSQSVFKRLTRTSTESKNLIDKRVSRLLAWLWINYPSSQMNVRFVLGLENGRADVMSRWGSRVRRPMLYEARVMS